MEYIKKEELIEGEIYKIFNTNIDKYVYFKQNYTTDNQIYHLGFISEYNNYYVKVGYHGLLNPSFEITTSEEKHWLNECIKLDKFITFEEAMKTFIPEYVECIKNATDRFTKNKIYQVKEQGVNRRCFILLDNQNISTNVPMVGGLWSFKPSTKEAYDAQFVVKEPEFVLPKLWHIVITSQNYKILSKYFLNKFPSGKLYEKGIMGFYDTNRFGHTRGSLTGSGYDFGIEITFEQFKKYVLKEENVIEEIKTIEPLSQFKVIETIETITKVENNEGNQFFIGDVVKSELGNTQKITRFKYNINKTDILAVCNNGIQISINKIEHYIEPKVEVKDEFILPEKWCIKRNSENDKIVTDYINTISSYKHYYLNNNRYNPYLHNNASGCCSHNNVRENYTEITFDQFKKYVLKETTFGEPGMIFIPEETLLEKAKRLYPVGTKFIPTQRRYKIYEISTGEFIENNNNIFHKKNMVSIFYDNKWAEIIE